MSNLQRYEQMFTCPITLVYVSGVHCHMCTSSTSGCASEYFTAQYCIEYTISTSRPGCPEATIKAVVMQLVHKKCQTLYCTTVLFKVLYCKIKNILFFVCCLCIICVKSIINLLQYSTI